MSLVEVQKNLTSSIKFVRVRVGLATESGLRNKQAILEGVPAANTSNNTGNASKSKTCTHITLTHIHTPICSLLAYTVLGFDFILICCSECTFCY